MSKPSTARTVRIDLHCHSSESDGELPPERVARELARAEVRCASLADHDTVSGQDRFRTALASRGIRFISGAEIQAESPVGTLHLLAHGFDLHDQAFLRALRALRSPLLSHAHAWKDRLWALAARHGRAGLGRLAGAGPGRGGLSSEGAAPIVIAPRSSAAAVSPSQRWDGQLEVAAAIGLVHGAGGLVSLAHPLTGPAGLDGEDWRDRLDELLIWLRSLGLDGVEAIYKPYPRGLRQELLAAAERHCLLATAGSDFHGPHTFDSASPGIDMPEEHWDRFLRAVEQHAAERQARPAALLSLAESHVSGSDDDS